MKNPKLLRPLKNPDGSTPPQVVIALYRTKDQAKGKGKGRDDDEILHLPERTFLEIEQVRKLKLNEITQSKLFAVALVHTRSHPDADPLFRRLLKRVVSVLSGRRKIKRGAVRTPMKGAEAVGIGIRRDQRGGVG